jgi:hypothetical protein
MEGFSFVTPVTGLNRPNTGKEDDDSILHTQVLYASVNTVSSKTGLKSVSVDSEMAEEYAYMFTKYANMPVLLGECRGHSAATVILIIEYRIAELSVVLGARLAQAV